MEIKLHGMLLQKYSENFTWKTLKVHFPYKNYEFDSKTYELCLVFGEIGLKKGHGGKI